jgi:hypothetical protein
MARQQQTLMQVINLAIVSIYIYIGKGIFFSKDRREEVIEVEEEPAVVLMPDVDEKAKLMTQGQWMKGCPEGGEQGFLFSQYHELSQGQCLCPYGCGTSVSRQKCDFFALFVSDTHVRMYG